MKVLTYEYEKMVRAGQILNALPFCGTQSARLIVELADILDSGKPGEIIEKEEVGNGVHREKVQQDQLEE